MLLCFSLYVILPARTVRQANGWNLFQGKYAVLADVYTEDKQKITCLRADDIIF
jgi:hypothetical protein